MQHGDRRVRLRLPAAGRRAGTAAKGRQRAGGRAPKSAQPLAGGFGVCDGILGGGSRAATGGRVHYDVRREDGRDGRGRHAGVGGLRRGGRSTRGGSSGQVGGEGSGRGLASYGHHLRSNEAGGPRSRVLKVVEPHCERVFVRGISQNRCNRSH